MSYKLVVLTVQELQSKSIYIQKEQGVYGVQQQEMISK